jgi:hypothetical protein
VIYVSLAGARQPAESRAVTRAAFAIRVSHAGPSGRAGPSSRIGWRTVVSEDHRAGRTDTSGHDRSQLSNITHYTEETQRIRLTNIRNLTESLT